MKSQEAAQLKSYVCDHINMRSKTDVVEVVVLILVNSHRCAVTLSQKIVVCGKQKACQNILLLFSAT